MAADQRQLHLGAFLQGVGHHLAAWRHPDVDPRNALRFDHFKQLARTAERGKFDAIFFADSLGVPEAPPALLARGLLPSYLEPLTKLAVVAGVTERIGLISTVSTTYLPPFHLARKFASLDVLSGGRTGWNLVTSGTEWEAHNFNLETQVPHAERYSYAREYVDIVKGLWDGWGDDALRFDKEAGVVFDPDKLHVLNHQSERFRVRGPLVSERPPQGYPVIVQAGSSADGQALAAATAEVVFTAQQTLEDARGFYSGLKAQLAQHGRAEDSLKIMPGVLPIIGRTEQEAKDKYEQLQSLIDPVLGVGLLNAFLGNIDLSKYPLDGPVPDFPLTEGWQSRQKLFVDLARRENLTLRQLYQRVSGARGHRIVLGTAETVADQLEDWFVNGAADGFNILPPTLPQGLNDFVELVVPVLQGRGLFRTEYRGHTLREHLGLARPRNQFE
ncbi:NtaA/DmoA family FMN-dependent monooxygenase [Duganella sp. FT135W]|uniref:NtaA/DmoA family FMN-dependent monooxygenase n=1 Tax=Duganella flavida TaxID=2692175 RepID=A0A6L8KAI7_9BURK|nr:NtaA/DmoA family FMN-dependent monooxygenase [Duganella flavida]